MLIVLSINAFFLNVAVDPYTALMADLVPPSQRGRVGTVLAIFNMLGQIAATLIALFLWTESPQLVFVLVSAILVISFAITTIGVREPDAPPSPKGRVRIDVGKYVRDLLAQRELTKYVLAAAVFWLGTGVWSLAQPIGAVIAGILIGSFDSYRASFVGAAVLVFVAFLLLLTVRAPRVVRPA